MIGSVHNDELDRYIEELDLNLTKDEVRDLGWQQSRAMPENEKIALGRGSFFFLRVMCVCLFGSSGVYLLKINRTMTTYNQHGTFNWFEVDGSTYILFKVGSHSVLLN